MFSYTKHARDKLRRKESKKLQITKKTIQAVVEKPIVVDKSSYPVMAIAPITRHLSLCVVFKKIGKDYKIITFFPAKKGRYEGKVS